MDLELKTNLTYQEPQRLYLYLYSSRRAIYIHPACLSPCSTLELSHQLNAALPRLQPPHLYKMLHKLLPGPLSGRLKWSLPSPLESAVSVLSDGSAPTGPSEPYFTPTSDGGTWHAISEESICITPQSTITTRICDFDTWESDWEERHADHADPDDPECVFAEPEGSDGDGEDEDDDDEGERGDLLECCGEKRPQPPGPLVIHATTKEYVTVHDFVSAVHPWLMQHFSDIWEALHIWDGDEYDQSQKLVVSYSDLESLSIISEDMWAQVLQVTAQPVIPPAMPPAGSSVGRQAGPPGMPPTTFPKPLARKATAEVIRKLNEQMRREGSSIRYQE